MFRPAPLVSRAEAHGRRFRAERSARATVSRPGAFERRSRLCLGDDTRRDVPTHVRQHAPPDETERHPHPIHQKILDDSVPPGLARRRAEGSTSATAELVGRRPRRPSRPISRRGLRRRRFRLRPRSRLRIRPRSDRRRRRLFLRRRRGRPRDVGREISAKRREFRDVARWVAVVFSGRFLGKRLAATRVSVGAYRAVERAHELGGDLRPASFGVPRSGRRARALRQRLGNSGRVRTGCAP